MAQILVPPANSGYDMRYAPHGVTGFEYSGNQYIFAVEGNEGLAGNSFKIHVQKSIDSGANWTETSTATFSNGGRGSATAYTTCVDGGTVYILAVDTWGPNSDPFTTDLCTGMQMWTYNLSTDAMSGPSTPGGAPQVYKFWHGTISNGFQTNKAVPIHLVRRGAGDMLLVYSGIPEVVSTNKQARLYVAPFNGSTIGSSTMIAGQAGNAFAYTSGAVDVDNLGYLHIVYCSIPSGKVYIHVAMDGSGNFGTPSSVEANGFFNHLDPPEEMSRLAVWGTQIGFVGVRDNSADGAIYFYTAPAGQLNPAWTDHSVGNTTPVVLDPRNTSCISTSAAFLVDNTIHVFWTRSGITPSWSVTGDAGCVRHVAASTSDLSTWTAEATVLDNTPVGGNWAASNVNAWSGTSIVGVFGTFDKVDGTEFGSFIALTANTSQLSRTVSDSLVFSDHLESTTPRTDQFSDSLVLADGPPLTHLATVGSENPGPSGGSTPPPGSGMGNCIFEFYEMQTPEDVEVLPTPKKYDQLGPMRFDKIGKIFGFRVRLIMNGTTVLMPYKVYGDDSESDPTLNSIYYQGNFIVRPGIDNVYEVQFPKSVNTDIFRITFGPTPDSFHRYDVLVKVHTSGMKGQARWMPIR